MERWLIPRVTLLLIMSVFLPEIINVNSARHTIMLVTAALTALYAASAVSAGALGIKQGKLAITSPDGVSDVSFT